MSESPDTNPQIFTPQKERATVGYAKAATLAAMEVFLPSIVSMQPTKEQMKENKLGSVGLKMAAVAELGVIAAVGGGVYALTGSAESAALMAAVTYPVAKAATLGYQFVAMHAHDYLKEGWEISKKAGKEYFGIGKGGKPSGTLLHDVERASDLTKFAAKTVGVATEVLLPGLLTARKVEGGALGINRLIQGAGIISETAGYALLGGAAIQGRPDLALAGVAAIVGGKVATMGAEVAEHISKKSGGVLKAIADIPIKAVETFAGGVEKVADYRENKAKELKSWSDGWKSRYKAAFDRIDKASARLS